MFFGMIFAALFWGLWLLLLIFPLRVILVAITRPRGMPRQPVCDRCRYPVAGLSGLNCPECGANLLVSGVITPAMEMRRRGSLAWALVAWSLLVLIIGGYILTIIWMTTAFSGFGAATTTTTTTITLSPSTTAVAPLSASVAQSFDDTGAPAGATVTLSRQGGGNAAVLSAMQDANGAWSWFHATGPGGQLIGSGTALTEADVVAWLVSMGADPTSLATREHAAELLGLIGDLAAAGDPATVTGTANFTLVAGGMQTTTGIGAAPVPGSGASTAFWVVLVVVLGVWGAGTWFIIWRRRVLRRRYGVGVDSAGAPGPAPAPAASTGEPAR